MTDRLKFPHLESLSKLGSAAILQEGWVSVTEKIDGFNARFGRDIDGTFWVGTRNREFDPAVESQQGFAEYALSRAYGVEPGHTLFGEWAGKGIQKRLDYGEPDFYLFDVHVGEDWGNEVDLATYAEVLNCRRPRMFHLGTPPTIDQLEEWRNLPGIEGVVLRSYPMLKDRSGHSLIVKFKAVAFSERMSEKVQHAPPDLTNVVAFVNDYATKERLAHVLAAVADDGRGFDPLDPRQTGDVLRGMYADIIREGSDDFTALSEADQKMVGKVSASVTKPMLEAARMALIG